MGPAPTPRPSFFFFPPPTTGISYMDPGTMPSTLSSRCMVYSDRSKVFSTVRVKKQILLERKIKLFPGRVYFQSGLLITEMDGPDALDRALGSIPRVPLGSGYSRDVWYSRVSTTHTFTWGSRVKAKCMDPEWLCGDRSTWNITWRCSKRTE